MDGQMLFPGPDRRRKAAMVVRLLLADGQKLALSRLPEEAQVNLTREMTRLRLVDRDTLNAVAEEFAQAIESIGLATSGDAYGVLDALDGQLSPGALARLRREAARARGVDPWALIASLPAPDLAQMMEREGIEVAAIALSKLPAPLAAQTLPLLPGERARRITYAMSQTARILPETVARIGRALAAEYASDPDPAFAIRPEARVGAILNSSRRTTRDSVLDSLTETDAGFAEQVRREIFTFGNIHERIRAIDIPRAVRGIDNADLIRGLSHGIACGEGEERSARFILTHMPQRMADTLRDEITDLGPVRRSDGERAQTTIIDTIRERVDNGEINFQITVEEEEG